MRFGIFYDAVSILRMTVQVVINHITNNEPNLTTFLPQTKSLSFTNCVKAAMLKGFTINL